MRLHQTQRGMGLKESPQTPGSLPPHKAVDVTIDEKHSLEAVVHLMQ
jgi:hypothetical protein